MARWPGSSPVATAWALPAATAARSDGALDPGVTDHVRCVGQNGSRQLHTVPDGKTYVPVASGGASVLTPDDVKNGHLPDGPVVVFDDDNYDMAGGIAERRRAEGLEVTYVTDPDSASDWACKTSERGRIRTRLMQIGGQIVTAHALTAFDNEIAMLACEYPGVDRGILARGAVLVTQFAPRGDLYRAILDRVDGTAEDLPLNLRRIGDCEALPIITAAVAAGHRYATERETTVGRDVPLRHGKSSVAFSPTAAPTQQGVASFRPALVAAVSTDRACLAQLLRCCGEEVEGEAWYRALAERRPLPRFLFVPADASRAA